MSVLPSNQSAAQRFISDEPDWGKPVKLSETYETSINISRSGLETRARKRMVPRRQLEYASSGLTGDEYQTRAQAAQLDARALLWVPLWCEPEILQADQTAPNYTGLLIGNARRAGLFRVGDWVYLVDGTDKQFRQIASETTATEFVLETTGSPIEFLGDAIVYPCMAAEMIVQNFELANYAPESRELRLVFRSTGIPVSPSSFASTPPVESTTRSNQDAGS